MSVGPAAPDEVDAALDVDELAFGSRIPDHMGDATKKEIAVDRLVVSREGDQLVGAAQSLPAQMTLPGPLAVPAAAITGVSVLPTHRREGRLREMMCCQLEDLHQPGGTV
ncbi:MAG: GNAT family N-acetyltransferase, partial [Acidimicrobiales bacterium]